MTEVKWIKIVTNIFENRKIRQIETLPDYDSILVIWLKIITLAGELNYGGTLLLTDEIAYSDEMLASEFRRPVNTVRLAIDTFFRFGMMEEKEGVYSIKNWERYQSAEKLERIREQNKARALRFRQNKKLEEATETKGLQPRNVTRNAAVTQSNATEIELEIEKEKDTTRASQEMFLEFWNAYPKKCSRGDAEKAFAGAKFTKPMLKKVLKALEQQKKSEGWVCNDGRYIPYPARWIRVKGWEDESGEKKHGSGKDANRNEL